MSVYEFQFRRSEGAGALLDFADCADDAEALGSARRMLSRHASRASAEVFDGPRRVAQVEREVAASAFILTAQG